MIRRMSPLCAPGLATGGRQQRRAGRAAAERAGPVIAIIGRAFPDREVIDELHRIGATVLRTDERDANCPLTHRIGPDSGPGGCDSYIITVAP